MLPDSVLSTIVSVPSFKIAPPRPPPSIFAWAVPPLSVTSCSVRLPVPATMKRRIDDPAAERVMPLLLAVGPSMTTVLETRNAADPTLVSPTVDSVIVWPSRLLSKVIVSAVPETTCICDRGKSGLSTLPAARSIASRKESVLGSVVSSSAELTTIDNVGTLSKAPMSTVPVSARSRRNPR